ncbi:MAG TPA: Xaa-Pro peptidase family protein, partial [Dysgonamonadaceae bacterium]|nr:Xaa-Pro peptidase family protein [Dysgonamonadaceae bacterium]
MNIFSRDEIAKRVKQVQQYIVDQKFDACVITSPVNMYYLNGFIFNGYMYIMPERDPLLFVKRPITIKGDNVEHIRKPEQLPELLEARNIVLPKSILLESDLMPYNGVVRFQKALHMPTLKSISGQMRVMRSVKSDAELGEIRKSALTHVEVHKQIPSLYRPGMTDLEFQIEIEYLMRKHGSIGPFRTFGENMDIFMGNVLAGDNAETPSPFDFAMGGKGTDPILPLGPSNKVMKQGTTVMIDMAGNFTSYLSDITRTYSIGTAPEEALRAHQLSIDIHKEIVGIAKEGVACADVYNRAMEIVAANNMEDYFMGTKQQARFVGHGMGLEINEPPVFAARTREVLKKNMAIALEPKFVLPGIGAVGVENTYIVTE